MDHKEVSYSIIKSNDNAYVFYIDDKNMCVKVEVKLNAKDLLEIQRKLSIYFEWDTYDHCSTQDPPQSEQIIGEDIIYVNDDIVITPDNILIGKMVTISTLPRQMLRAIKKLNLLVKSFHTYNISHGAFDFAKPIVISI